MVTCLATVAYVYTVQLYVRYVLLFLVLAVNSDWFVISRSYTLLLGRSYVFLPLLMSCFIYKKFIIHIIATVSRKEMVLI